MINLEITNKKNPFNDFKRIASNLMNDNVLIVADNNYRFTCLEFYYFEKNNHADVYSHQHTHQTTSARWYFHGSGLDITFGANIGDDKVYGGILIRGIKRIKDDKFINGPIVCVQELFSNLGAIDTSQKLNFYIEELAGDSKNLFTKSEEVYYSKRVNINKLIDTSKNQEFYNGLYRFFINLKQTQKDKGDIAVDLLAQGYSEEQINVLFGYKHFRLK